MEPSAQPPPTPEGALLRFCRKAAGMTADEAAAAVRARGGKISAGYWRDVERGYGASRGKRVAVRASGGLLARMAREIPGITPGRLETEGQRPDAARFLEEILAQAAPGTPAAPAGDGRLPAAEGFARQMGVGPGDPDDPHLRSVREDIAAAVLAHGTGATGAQVFHGRPGSEIEARLWDDPGLSQESKELAIATLRADRARYEAGRPGNSSSGTAGLALAAVRGP